MHSINDIIWGWGINSLHLLCLSHRARLSSGSEALQARNKGGRWTYGDASQTYRLWAAASFAGSRSGSGRFAALFCSEAGLNWFLTQTFPKC